MYTHTGYLSWSRNAAICAGIAATVRIFDTRGLDPLPSVGSESLITGVCVCVCAWVCGCVCVSVCVHGCVECKSGWVINAASFIVKHENIFCLCIVHITFSYL